MVAFVLLSISTGIIGIQMHKAIQKKKFHTQVERLRDRLTMTQKLAVAMQVDWNAQIKQDSKKWLFEAKSFEPEVRALKPLKIDAFEISFNGMSVDSFELNFYSTGLIEPKGVLVFSFEEESIEWKTSDEIIFKSILK